MTRASEPGRPEKILDAAEHAFAEHGFAGASLRDIVKEARVNLATVYYYFGSKDGLMEAVFKRQFDPLRAEQLEMLRQFEHDARGRAVAAEKILEAMLVPLLRLATSAPQKRQAVARLIGRIVTDPNGQTQRLLHRQRAEVRTAFLKAMQISLPDLPLSDLQWRMEFVWGALSFVMCNPHRIEKETKGACDPANAARVAAEMITFFAPGLRAPRADSTGPDRARPRLCKVRNPKLEIRNKLKTPGSNVQNTSQHPVSSL